MAGLSISTTAASAGFERAGVAVAILGAASSRSRAADRGPVRYPEDPPDRDPPQRPDAGGIERAVEMCVAEIERGGDRVEAIDSAVREAAGWLVTGALDSGAGFTCRIDNDGRIGAIDRDDAGYQPTGIVDRPLYPGGEDDRAPYRGEVPDDRQYGDDIYYRARQRDTGGPEPYTDAR